jgi:hypothetical protein
MQGKENRWKRRSNLSDIPAINRFLSYRRIRTVPSKTVVIHAGDLPDVPLLISARLK